MIRLWASSTACFHRPRITIGRCGNKRAGAKEDAATKTNASTTSMLDDPQQLVRGPSPMIPKASRDRSHAFEDVLDVVLGPLSKNKQAIFQEGEKHYAAEMFRFYAAILNWEKEAATSLDKNRIRMQACKLVANFVEVGSPFENGCLSSATRKALLARNVTPNFFDDAKYEVGKDIMMNGTLREIIERYTAPLNPAAASEIGREVVAPV